MTSSVAMPQRPSAGGASSLDQRLVEGVDAAPAAVAVRRRQRDLLLLLVAEDEQAVLLHPDVGVVEADDHRPAGHPAAGVAFAGRALGPHDAVAWPP